MIQNIIHQDKDSLVQDIPWKGIPVVYEVAPTFLTAGKSIPSLSLWYRSPPCQNLSQSQLPSLVRREGLCRAGSNSSVLQMCPASI